ncbi:hypothetical protein [Streptomyces phaeochromogenes]|uniref:hypothetical protein n=1 Tax=Streptomyces phaeochromogenes TaxID=1923 RepID=UPI0006E39D15|nr:hypothetical protein [Streptomyces phaeochromogenes]
MVSVTHAAHDIDITAEGLQEELARLELQKQALERELAAVAAHLGSVRRTLTAFESMRHAATPATAAPQAAVPSPAAAGMPSAAPRAQKPKADRTTKHPTPTDADTNRSKYGQLTEQIMEYFAEVGDTDVRARDVAAALGRDTDSGSINAVRSTLDRLVGTSHIRRTGRGLYRAKRS